MTPRMQPSDIGIIFHLNERQALFVYYYLGEARYNASRAAVMAGYSPKHPRQSGHQVIHSERVAAAVDWLFEQYQARRLEMLPQLRA